MTRILNYTQSWQQYRLNLPSYMYYVINKLYKRLHVLHINCTQYNNITPLTTTRDLVNLELNLLGYFLLIASMMASPILAGDIVTFTPAFVNASIFSEAPPFPPAMIAPA